MIDYEVNIRVPTSELESYRGWLLQHIADMLRLPGFLSAEVARSEPMLLSAGQGALETVGSQEQATMVVRYRLESRAALTRYLVEFAPQLRAQSQTQYGRNFPIERRALILESSNVLRAPVSGLET